MTQLKTLKDLYEVGWGELEARALSKARAEAVKWVKEDLKCMKEMYEEDYMYICADARIDFIKHFFDLTEEDISNGEN